MLSRRSEVVQFLVEQGHPQNLAKAAVEECFNLGHPELSEDWLWCIEVDSSVSVGKITREFAVEMYETMRKMLAYGPGGIYVHGELRYNMNGDKIE